jgi:OOP family OmpA-OmpF porin
MLVLSAFLLTASAVSAQSFGAEKPRLQKVILFGDQYKNAPPVIVNQARIVVYRDANAPTEFGTNVSIDGALHTSLLPNGYASFCVPSGSHTLSIHVDDGNGQENSPTARYPINAEGGKTYFARVEEGRERNARIVYTDGRDTSLPAAREQRHIVSRTTDLVPCEPALVTQPIVEKQLNGEVLFAFNGTDEKDIILQSSDAIKLIANDLSIQDRASATLHVNGHADPIGKDSVNKRIAMERAKTVKALLERYGIRPDRIAIHGHGSSQPVIETCTQHTLRERIQCNQPNRRVTIVVDGMSKSR